MGLTGDGGRPLARRPFCCKSNSKLSAAAFFSFFDSERVLCVVVGSVSPFCANKRFLCCQLFWEKKLSGLNAFDIAEELVKTMDLPKGLQGKCSLPLTPGVAF